MPGGLVDCVRCEPGVRTTSGRSFRSARGGNGDAWTRCYRLARQRGAASACRLALSVARDANQVTSSGDEQ